MGTEMFPHVCGFGRFDETPSLGGHISRDLHRKTRTRQGRFLAGPKRFEIWQALPACHFGG